MIAFRGISLSFEDEPLIGGVDYHYDVYSYSSDARYSTAPVSVDLRSPKNIYRSVEVGQTSALATGTGNNLVIDGLEANISADLPDHIGVGDIILYDPGNAGVRSALAVVSARIGPRRLYVLDVAGLQAQATTADDQDWHIYRAYTSLAGAEAGIENAGIDDGLEDFDDFSLAAPDLPVLDAIWHIALYANAVADQMPVTIVGWTTDDDHYLKIFSPTEESEVGESQRHGGAWDGTKYRLEGNMPASPYQFRGFLEVQIPFARIEGVQVHVTGYTDDSQYAVYLNYAGASQEMHFSHNIVRGADAGANQYAYLVFFAHSGTSTGKFLMWNNVLYDAFNATWNGFCYSQYSDGVQAFIFNNTVSNCNGGFDFPLGSAILINNIADARDVGFGTATTFGTSSDHNLSTLPGNQGGAPGSNSSSGVTLTFLDGLNGDFRLHVSDAAAIGSGLRLSEHADLRFTDDIEGLPRGEDWDVGADQR